MALCGSSCFSGLLASALVALLFLPTPFYVMKPIPPPSPTCANFTFPRLPPLDLFISVSLVSIALFNYLCEWIQRKLMERRIVKLNGYLNMSLERLRAWDAQQEQLEATLKMVQNACSEYGLLLYLLLREHRGAPARPARPARPAQPAAPNCFYEKELDDELTFLRNPTFNT